MSSTWKDDRIEPWNPVKVHKGFTTQMFMGSNTCVHTLNDEDGAWWKAAFPAPLTVTKVKVLNRGDCCGGRLNGAKILIGDQLCGKLKSPDQGKWITTKCKLEGSFIKI